MPKRLFVVTIEIEAVAYAEDASEAEEVVRSSLREVDGEIDDATFDAHPLTTHAANSSDYRNSIPWGEEGDRTVAEIVTREATAESDPAP